MKSFSSYCPRHTRMHKEVEPAKIIIMKNTLQLAHQLLLQKATAGCRCNTQQAATCPLFFFFPFSTFSVLLKPQRRRRRRHKKSGLGVGPVVINTSLSHLLLSSRPQGLLHLFVAQLETSSVKRPGDLI